MRRRSLPVHCEPRQPRGPRSGAPGGQHPIDPRLHRQRGKGIERAIAPIERMMKCQGSNERTQHFSNRADVRNAAAEKTGDETGRPARARDLRHAMQARPLPRIAKLERLRVAQHHPYRNSHGVDNSFDQSKRRGQTTSLEIPDELDPAGASLLRFPGVFDGLGNDFEQHARVSLCGNARAGRRIEYCIWPAGCSASLARF